MKKAVGLCCIGVLTLVFGGLVTFAKEPSIAKQREYTKIEKGMQLLAVNQYPYEPFPCIDILEPVIELKSEIVELPYKTEYDPASNVLSCYDLFDGECEYFVVGSYDKNTPDDYTICVTAQDASKNQAKETYTIRVLSKTVSLKEEDTSVDEDMQVKDIKNDNPVEQPDKASSISAQNKLSEPAGAEPKAHGVNTGNAKIYHSYTEHFADAMSLIKNDVTRFDIAYLQSITEIDYLLLASSGVSTPVSETLGGPVTGVEIKSDYVSVVKEAVVAYDKAQERYQTFIKNALYSMDLYATDKELVDQINAYIIKTFSYRITNEKLMSAFIDGKEGQCMHYARLFSDMCKAAGISGTYIEGYANGESHAFNSVTIDGVKYYFDVSWNDVLGDSDAYSWLSEAELRKTHSW